MVRAAAGAALLLGTAALLGYLHELGKSPLAAPEARHLRAMKDRVQPPDSIVPFTFDDFVALPHALPLPEYTTLERRAVSLEGYVQSMHRSLDGDFYLDMTPAPTEGPRDVPKVTTELTPQWRRGSENWRWERLAARLRPHDGRRAPWPGGQRRARISGWLLYDFQVDAPYLPVRHVPYVTRGRGTRLTGWEIHPVTRIEVWDDSLAAFVEYPR